MSTIEKLLFLIMFYKFIDGSKNMKNIWINTIGMEKTVELITDQNYSDITPQVVTNWALQIKIKINAEENGDIHNQSSTEIAQCSPIDLDRDVCKVNFIEEQSCESSSEWYATFFINFDLFV